MREIKFRAWDKDREIMVYSDLRNKNDWTCDYFFQQNDKGNIICYWEYDYDDNFGYPTSNGGEEENLMQYTGLKDKNGTEIYEGDIVKCVSELYSNFGKHPTGTYSTDIVEILLVNDDSYCFGTRKIGKQHISTPVLRICAEKYYEVIGNIYQNPELLEV